MLRRFLDSVMLKEIDIELRNIVSKAKDNARWSKRIPNAISSTRATVTGDGKYEASIQVDLNIAPEAAAFEFGSGVHRKDNPQTYIIKNRTEGKMLQIPASRWKNKLFNDDPAYLPFVNHPGVAAKPFLIPAVNSRSFYLSRALAKAFGVGILDAIKLEWNKK